MAKPSKYKDKDNDILKRLFSETTLGSAYQWWSRKDLTIPVPRSKMSKIPQDCASGKDRKEASSVFLILRPTKQSRISSYLSRKPPTSELGHRKSPDRTLTCAESRME